MKIYILAFVLGLFSSVVHAADFAQIDCKLNLQGAGGVNYSAEFYGDTSGGNMEVIKQAFDLNQIKGNLRVLFINQRLFIQLTQLGPTDLWLSSEGQAAKSKEDLVLLFDGKLLSPELDGLSSVRCVRR